MFSLAGQGNLDARPVLLQGLCHQWQGRHSLVSPTTRGRAVSLSGLEKGDVFGVLNAKRGRGSSGGGKHDWLGDGGERVTQVYTLEGDALEFNTSNA